MTCFSQHVLTKPVIHALRTEEALLLYEIISTNRKPYSVARQTICHQPVINYTKWTAIG